MSKEELHALQELAIKYQRDRCPQKLYSASGNKPAITVHMRKLVCFYRNKPSSYWDDTFKQHNGIMKPYLKDNNGDPRSPINGKINGLFFSAIPDERGMPLPTSPFGVRRLNVPADYWMKNENTRLYFADFYCNSSSWHYVTLVMTERNREAVDFCRRKLIELDKFKNPFLTIIDDAVYTSTALHVELLYTDDIDIKQYVSCQYYDHRDLELIQSSGTSSLQGIPKTPGCPHCNLPSHAVSDMNEAFSNMRF